MSKKARSKIKGNHVLFFKISFLPSEFYFWTLGDPWEVCKGENMRYRLVTSLIHFNWVFKFDISCIQGQKMKYNLTVIMYLLTPIKVRITEAHLSN